MNIKDLLIKIKNKEPMIVAIDGPSGAGKSTFSHYLETEFNVTVFHTDDYFLPPHRKTKQRLAEPGGNVDYERMLEEIFEQIDNDKISSHIFNCQTNQLERREAVVRNDVVVIEGVYSMHPLFQPYYDYTVFIDIDRDDQYERILARSNAQLLQRFKTEWIPLEDHYFDALGIRNKVDYLWKSDGKISEKLRKIVV